jgi:hypothetical protein
VLLPIGVFLTYTAATDSPLFNPEAWVKIFLKCKQYALIVARKIYKYIRKKTKKQ